MTLIEKSNYCPLCRSQKLDKFHEDRRRTYIQCSFCHLVFVPQTFWLSTEDEKSEYDLHNNNPMDPGYRRFLSRLSLPMLERLKPEQKGLDFGCGPGPALSEMMKEAGYDMEVYDPFYFNNPVVLDKKYDFITSTEVVEHLQNPGEVFSGLFNMLKPGSYLGLMTKLVLNFEAFKNWHYIHDLTHICFYSPETFHHLADIYSAELEFIRNDVIILRKN